MYGQEIGNFNWNLRRILGEWFSFSTNISFHSLHYLLAIHSNAFFEEFPLNAWYHFTFSFDCFFYSLKRWCRNVYRWIMSKSILNKRANYKWFLQERWCNVKISVLMWLSSRVWPLFLSWSSCPDWKIISKIAGLKVRG